MWKSHFTIHTFEDEIEFIQGLEKSTGKKIGIYPEIKAPWLHHKEGKDIALETLKVLKKYGYDSKQDLVYLQTFDFNELKRIKTELLPKLASCRSLNGGRRRFRSTITRTSRCSGIGFANLPHGKALSRCLAVI